MPNITRNNLEPLLIYTAEKCGSTTVLRAIQSIGMDAHRCTDLNISEYYIPRESLVISMVREPIAWSLSDMFENGMKYPSAGKILNWYQANFRQATGFNVFGQPFKKGLGYKIFSKRLLLIRTDKLVESLGKGLNELLSHWVVDPPMPEEVAVGHFASGEIRYGEAYAEFIKTYKLPKKHLEQVYRTQYYKQFFTQEEKKQFIAQWSK